MGTRADFYVGRGAEAEWLGSIAWDGHPGSVFDQAPELFGIVKVTESEWRSWVAEYLAGRDDGTVPDQGWPWPWNDSRSTDYAYALDGGVIWGSCFGRPWFVVDPTAENCGEPEEDSEVRVEVPDMSSRKAVTFGRRSGVIALGLGRQS